MPEVKISELPDGQLPLSGEERVPVNQGGVTVSVPAKAIAGASGEAQRVHVYVSAVAGSDANDGLTSSTPLRNGQVYVDRFETPPGFGVTMHFDTGAHSQVNWPAGWGRTQSIMMTGDGAGQLGDDGFTVVRAAEASQAGSTVKTIVAAASLDDTYRGATLELTSGAASGARRSICQVSGTNLTLGRDLPAGYVLGDSYRIVRPGAVIALTQYADIASGIGPVYEAVDAQLRMPDRALVLVNLDLSVAMITGSGAPVIADGTVLACGVRVSGAACRRLVRDAAWFHAPKASAALGEALWAGLAPVIAGAHATYPATAALQESLWGGWGTELAGASAQVGDGIGFVNVGGSANSLVNGGCVLQGGSGSYDTRPGAHLDIAPESDSRFLVSAAYGADGVIRGAMGHVETGGAGTVQVINQDGPAFALEDDAVLRSGVNCDWQSGAGVAGNVGPGGFFAFTAGTAVAGSVAGQDLTLDDETSTIDFATFTDDTPVTRGRACIQKTDG